MTVAARKKTPPTPFASAAKAVSDHGYKVIPIMPDSKSPGTCSMGRWRPMLEWQQHRDLPLGQFDIICWSSWPEANIGVVLGNQVAEGWEVGALDFDTDDLDELEKIQSSVPESPVKKRGRRGFTGFYLMPHGTKGKKFKKDGACVFEILTGNGTRQTVIPPSIHPETGKPYEWVTPETLGTVPAADLPRLDEDDLARLCDTLESIPGVLPAPERQVSAIREGDGNASYRAVNNAALGDLPAWVPALNLPKLRTTSAGYVGVPFWRPNRKGLSDSQRNPSLSFSDKGIRDNSEGHGMTAIDTVMAARGVGHPEAYSWLAKALGMWIDDDGEWTGITALGAIQAETAPPSPPDPETGEVVSEAVLESAPATQVDAPKPRSPLLTWFGATAPTPPRWLVNGILPEKGVAILAGQHGAGKTFVALDLAAAVVVGGEFADAQVRRQGGVLFLAAEGESEVDARMLAIINGKLNPPAPAPSPAAWLAKHEGKPPGLAGLHPEMPAPKPWPFARQVRDVPKLTDKDALVRLRAFTTAAAAEMAEYFDGAPLALIVLDTLSAAAGFEDENSASETQRVMNMLAQLSRETGALVLVVDHFGKAAETGVRGSSAKGAAADAILAVLAERSAAGAVSDRRMAVTKLRGGATGAVRPFELRETGIDEWGGSNCFVQWTASKDAAEVDEAAEMAEADTGVALLKAMLASPAGTQRDWASAIGKSKATVGNTLVKLQKDRLVECVLKRWSVTPKGQGEVAQRG